jgi:hypothetical protein
MDFEQQLEQLNNLRLQTEQIKSIVDSKAAALSVLESQLRQGQLPNNSAQQLDFNLSNSLSPLLNPGNIGDINNVIWPFYFTTDVPDGAIQPGETFNTGFSVTQEAAFIFMSYTKSVYILEGEDPDQTVTYLNQVPGVPSAPGLLFSLRDGSSSRQFYNTPINLDNFGNPRFPTKFPRPVMLLPNQSMQIQFTNAHSVNQYVPFITAFGYRIRIDRAQDLLSLVYG